MRALVLSIYTIAIWLTIIIGVYAQPSPLLWLKLDEPHITTAGPADSSGNNIYVTYEGYWEDSFTSDHDDVSGVAGDRWVSFGNNHMIAHQVIAAPTMSFCVDMEWWYVGSFNPTIITNDLGGILGSYAIFMTGGMEAQIHFRWCYDTTSQDCVEIATAQGIAGPYSGVVFVCVTFGGGANYAIYFDGIPVPTYIVRGTLDYNPTRYMDVVGPTGNNRLTSIGNYIAGGRAIMQYLYALVNDVKIFGAQLSHGDVCYYWYTLYGYDCSDCYYDPSYWCGDHWATWNPPTDVGYPRTCVGDDITLTTSSAKFAEMNRALIAWYRLNEHAVWHNGYVFDYGTHGHYGGWASNDWSNNYNLLTGLIDDVDGVNAVGRGALKFGNGQSNWVEMGSEIWSPSLTFCAWIRVESFTAYEQVLFTNGLLDLQGYGNRWPTFSPSFHLTLPGDYSPYLVIASTRSDDSSRWVGSRATVALTAGLTTHVCASVDQSTLTPHIWFNGIAIPLAPYFSEAWSTETIWNNRQSFAIGNWMDLSKYPTNSFNGAMDEVRIYNRSLTETETLSIWTCDFDTRPLVSAISERVLIEHGATMPNYGLSLYFYNRVGAESSLTMQLVSAPSWVTIASATYPFALSLMPPANQANGTYPVVMRAINGYGQYSPNATLYVNRVTSQLPDSTSTFQCCWTSTSISSPTTICTTDTMRVLEPAGAMDGTSLEPPYVTCTISPRSRGFDIVTSSSWFKAKLSGPGYATVLDSSIDTSFALLFLPPATGGAAYLDINIRGVPLARNVTIRSLAVPWSGTINCRPTVIAAGEIVNCTTVAKAGQATVYTTYALLTSSFGTAGIISAPFSISSVFDTWTPVGYASTYTSRIKLGSITGVYTIGYTNTAISSSSITVVAPPTQIVLSCGTATNSTTMAQNRQRTCTFTSYRDGLPVYALSSWFNFSGTPRTAFSTIGADISPAIPATTFTFSFTTSSRVVDNAMLRVFYISNSTRVRASLVVSVIQLPDNSSSISCDGVNTVSAGTKLQCRSTIRYNNTALSTPFSTLSLAASATASFLNVTSDVDTIDSVFTYTLVTPTISTSPQIIITDGVSIPYSIIVAEQPDGAVITCPSSLTYNNSIGATYDVCTIIPTKGGRVVWTRPDVFAVDVWTPTILDASSATLIAQPSMVLTGTPAPDATVADAFIFMIRPVASSFDTAPNDCTPYEYMEYYGVLPARFTEAQRQFSGNTGLGRLSITLRTGSSVIKDIAVIQPADSTSIVSCRNHTANGGVTNGTPVRCFIIPRLRGCAIYSSPSYFTLSIIQGDTAATVAWASTTPGSRLSFLVTPVIAHGPFTIYESLTGTTIALTSVPSGILLSWGESSLTTNYPLESSTWYQYTPYTNALARSTVDVTATALATPTLVESGSSSGNDRYVGISCRQTNCIGVTYNGDVYTWGNINEDASLTTSTIHNWNGRTGGTGVAQVMNGVEGHLVVQVSMVYGGLWNTTGPFTVLLRTDQGFLITWTTSNRGNQSATSSVLDGLHTPIVLVLPGSSYLISTGEFVLMSAQRDNVTGITSLYSWSIAGQSVNGLGRYGPEATPSLVGEPFDSLPATSTITHLHSCLYNSLAVIDGRSLWSWGTDLGTVLSSEVLPTEYTDFASVVLTTPSGWTGGPVVVTHLDGNHEFIAVLTNTAQLWILKFPFVTSTSDVLISALTPEPFQLFTTAKVAHCSIGYIRSLYATVDGSIYSFTPDSNLYCRPYSCSDYTYSELPGHSNVLAATLVSTTQKGFISVLYSDMYQYVSLVPATISIGTAASSIKGQIQSFVVASLTAALSSYTSVGTEFVLPSGTYTESRLTSSRDGLIIRGEGTTSTVLNCGSNVCLQLSGNNIQISDMTIKNGAAASGGILTIPVGKTVTFTNVRIQNSIATSSGGAFNVYGTLILKDCTIEGNAANVGGAIYVQQAAVLSISGTTFTGNYGSNGGAIAAATTSLVTLTSSVIHGNTALLDQSWNVPFNISANNPVYSLAGVSSSSSSFSLQSEVNNQPLMRRLLAATSSGGTDMVGGGIFCTGCTLALTNTQVTSNTATVGGGVYVTEGSIALTDALLTGNAAQRDGGGLVLEFASLTSTNANISYNTARNFGGGVYCHGDRPHTIAASVIQSNLAQVEGGGLYAVFCILTVTASTITDNAATSGGAMAVRLDASATITQCLFQSNRAHIGGALYFTENLVSTISFTQFIDNLAYANGGGIALPAPGGANVWINSTIWRFNQAVAGGCIYWGGRDVPTSLPEPHPTPSTDYPDEVVPDQYNNTWHASNTASSGHGPIWATPPTALSWATQLDQGLQFDSGVPFPPDFALVANLIDYYVQPCYDALTATFSFVPKTSDVTIVGTATTAFENGVFAWTNTTSIGVRAAPGSIVSTYGQVLLGDTTFVTEATTEIPIRACRAGEYDTGHECVVCEAGKYTSTAIQAKERSCKLCPPGSEQNATNQQGCNPCNAGYYAPSYGNPSCTPCDDQFWSSTNASSCNACPSNSKSTTDHLTCYCDAGYYASATRYECLVCPEGGNCPAGTSQVNMTALTTWWPALNRDNEEFLECINDACIDGGCKTGYQGHLCAVCAEGYGHSGQYTCGKCPSKGLNIFTLILACIAVLFVATVFVYSSLRGSRMSIFRLKWMRKHREHALLHAVASGDANLIRLARVHLMELEAGRESARKSAHTILLKILFSGIQFNSLARDFEYPWPARLLSLLQTQQSAANVGETLFSLDCFLGVDGNPFYIKTVMFAVLPFIIMVVPLAFFIPYSRRMRHDWELDKQVWQEIQHEKQSGAGMAHTVPGSPTAHRAILQASAALQAKENAQAQEALLIANGKLSNNSNHDVIAIDKGATIALPPAGAAGAANGAGLANARNAWSQAALRNAAAGLAKNTHKDQALAAKHDQELQIAHAAAVAALRPDWAEQEEKERVALGGFFGQKLKYITSGNVEGKATAATANTNTTMEDGPTAANPNGAVAASGNAAISVTYLTDLEKRRARLWNEEVDPAHYPWSTRLRDMYLTTVTVCLFFVYPNIASQTFALFRCKRLGLNSDKTSTALYLLGDLTQECYSTSHLAWMLGLGLPMMILWVFGIPSLAAGLLWYNRDRIRNQEPDTIMKYSFLYTGYNLQKYHFWEITVIIRKFLLVVIAVFGSDSQRTQQLLAVLVLVIVLVAHVYTMPFIDPLMNQMEFFSLLATFVTFFAGQFLSYDESIRSPMSAFIITFNICWMVACVIMLFYVFFYRDASARRGWKQGRVIPLQSPSTIVPRTITIAASHSNAHGNGANGNSNGNGHTPLPPPSAPAGPERGTFATSPNHFGTFTSIPAAALASPPQPNGTLAGNGNRPSSASSPPLANRQTSTAWVADGADKKAATNGMLPSHHSRSSIPNIGKVPTVEESHAPAVAAAATATPVTNQQIELSSLNGTARAPTAANDDATLVRPASGATARPAIPPLLDMSQVVAAQEKKEAAAATAERRPSGFATPVFGPSTSSTPIAAAAGGGAAKMNQPLLTREGSGMTYAVPADYVPAAIRHGSLTSQPSQHGRQDSSNTPLLHAASSAAVATATTPMASDVTPLLAANTTSSDAPVAAASSAPAPPPPSGRKSLVTISLHNSNGGAAGVNDPTTIVAASANNGGSNNSSPTHEQL